MKIFTVGLRSRTSWLLIYYWSKNNRWFWLLTLKIQVVDYFLKIRIIFMHRPTRDENPRGGSRRIWDFFLKGAGSYRLSFIAFLLTSFWKNFLGGSCFYLSPCAVFQFFPTWRVWLSGLWPTSAWWRPPNRSRPALSLAATC